MMRTAGMGLVFGILVALAGAGVGSAAARHGDATPAAAAGIEPLLPAVGDLGDGWVLVGEPGTFAMEGAYRERLEAAFGGPVGSRILLVVLVPRAGVSDAAWEEAGLRFDAAKLDLAYDSAQEAALAAEAPPAGCDRARRVEGIGPDDHFTTGLTLCGVDDRLVVLASVSGEVGGLAGYRAADAVGAMVAATALGIPGTDATATP